MNNTLVPLFLSFAFIIILAGCSNSSTDDSSLRIMSYNIKFDDKSDTVNSWDQRKEQVINLMEFYEPDFLGTQEALLHQLQDIENGLGNMNWIGVGRT
ncbi:MAG: hypothetical protein ACNS64_07885, partial [Candidatus Halalkalibacterium sp. M3_1C_030]